MNLHKLKTDKISSHQRQQMEDNEEEKIEEEIYDISYSSHDKKPEE